MSDADPVLRTFACSLPGWRASSPAQPTAGNLTVGVETPGVGLRQSAIGGSHMYRSVDGYWEDEDEEQLSDSSDEIEVDGLEASDEEEALGDARPGQGIN